MNRLRIEVESLETGRLILFLEGLPFRIDLAGIQQHQDNEYQSPHGSRSGNWANQPA